MTDNPILAAIAKAAEELHTKLDAIRVEPSRH
jgi:hypothetical protein